MNSSLIVSDFVALVEAIANIAQYASSVAHAKKERQHLLSQFQALKVFLDELEGIMSKSVSPLGYPSAIIKLRPHLMRCKASIDGAETVLQKNTPKLGKMKRLIFHCTWPSTAKELRDKTLKLREHQAMFQSVLAADTWKMEFAQLETQEKAHQELKRKEVINWVTKFSADYQDQHYEIGNTRVCRTGEWFLNLPELQGFRQCGNDEYRLLWCHGLPGAGKTHLAWRLIDALIKTFENDLGSVVLYWYFDYRDPRQHTLILPSLLLQLIYRLPALHPTIGELYGHGKAMPTKPILIKKIDALLREFKQSFIVLDALDECINSLRDETLNTIEHLQSLGVRILITSRQTGPKKIFSEWVHVEMKAHAEDLGHLIDHKLDNSFSQTIRDIMSKELKEEVIETIASKTDGMFLWASLQLDEVLDSSEVSNVREVLHNMPKDISGFFSRTMSRIANNGFALRTLLWLAYAKEPLSFDALSHALSIQLEKGILSDIDRDNIPHIEALVEKCCGLIVKDGENNLQLAHFSIQEYLKSNPQVLRSAIDPDLYIAKVCLRYLSLGVFEAKCESGFGGRMRKYPLLHYAARRWRWHVPYEIQSAEIEMRVLENEILHLYSHEGLFENYINAVYPFVPRHITVPWKMKPYYGEVRKIPLYNAIELQLPGVICYLLNEKDFCPLGGNARATLLMRAVRDNRKDFVDLLLKAGIDPSIKGYGPEASEWNIFRDATKCSSGWQGSVESVHQDKLFSKELYPSTLAIIMGYRDIFDMLRDEDNLDVIGDILVRAVEEEDNGQEILADVLQEYPAIDHRHAAYIEVMERRIWEVYPPKSQEKKGEMLQMLIDARPQIDNQDGLLDKLLPSVISYLPKEYVTTFLNKGACRDASEDSSKALSAAIDQKDEHLVISLVDRGAKVSARVFQEAVWEKMNDLVNYMLDKGYDASAKNNDVSVTTAIFKRHIDTLQILLSRGANVESIGLFEDRTALHIAVNKGEDTTITRILLDNGANPNAHSVRFGTPLSIASASNHEAIIKLLIEYGAEINYVGVSKYDTALCAAASNCSLRACRLLLDNGADPNCREALALLAAIESKDNISVIEILLEKGADPMKKNCKQEYALEKAVHHGRADIVRLFLEKGATLDACGSRGSILHAAAASQKEGMIQIMLDLGAKVTENPDKFGSILQWARPEDYQLLIDNGAKVNPPIPGYRYGTTIQAAISRITDSSGNEEKTQEKIAEAIGFLVEETGDAINATGGFYGSALQAASSKGYLGIVDLLLRKGALVNANGGRCGTALQAASYHGHVFVVYWLLENGADVNQMGGLYGTALQAAAFNGRAEVVELLLEHGADVNLEGGKYNTALDAAKQRQPFCQERVKTILLSRGAVDRGLEYAYDSAEDSDDYDKSSDIFDYNEGKEESM